MIWSRRQFLQLGASSLALASLQCRKRAQPAPPATRVPRYVVILYLDGGIDPIFTLNPKTRDELASEVDAPVSAGDIVESGAIRLGPHFAPLAPWASRMAIVNGIAFDTANHNTGWAQIVRLRTGVYGTMPGILDIVGDHGDGQPLACVTYGDMAPPQFTSGYADGERVFAIHDAGRERLKQLSTSLQAEANGLAAPWQDPHLKRTADDYRQVGLLAERLEDVPPYAAQAWDDVTDKRMSDLFQRTLWAIEHDLTRCAFIKVRPYAGWDSHDHNVLRQRNCSRVFTGLMAHFMRELETRRNAHGTLAEQTLIVSGSEIGRFPLLNGNAGKDHFPESSFMFFGAGVSHGAVFGATDNRMSALPIDVDSGQRATRGGHKIRLDDIGATVLAAAGISPEPYGYDGKVLPFLVARS